MRKNKAEIMKDVESVKSKFVAQNTIEYIRENGERVIRLHLTDIITFKTNGDIVLNSGGYRTVTTKDRINKFLPPGWHIWQEKRIWYLNRLKDRKTMTWTNNKDIVFNDGRTLHKRGRVSGKGPSPKELLKLQGKIAKYVHGYMGELFAGNVPAPSGGDCWSCLFFDKMPNPDSSHILCHFDEPYYVPTLLMRAVEDLPVSRAASHVLGYLWNHHDQEAKYWTNLAKSQLGKSLKRYLNGRLGLAR
jgi:uncharacterized protein YegP (UPF0339 family)